MMEDIARLDMESSSILQQYRSLMSAGKPDPAAVEKLSADYDALFRDYIAANAEAEAVPYAIMHLEGQGFLDAYNAMTPAAKQSPIALFLEPQKQYVERQIEAERRKVEPAERQRHRTRLHVQGHGRQGCQPVTVPRQVGYHRLLGHMVSVVHQGLPRAQGGIRAV